MKTMPYRVTASFSKANSSPLALANAPMSMPSADTEGMSISGNLHGSGYEHTPQYLHPPSEKPSHRYPSFLSARTTSLTQVWRSSPSLSMSAASPKSASNLFLNTPAMLYFPLRLRMSPEYPGGQPQVFP